MFMACTDLYSMYDGFGHLAAYMFISLMQFDNSFYCMFGQVNMPGVRQ